MAFYPFRYEPGQYSVYQHEHGTFQQGVSRHSLGDVEAEDDRYTTKGDMQGTPRAVMFTPEREEVIMRWEWINRFNKSILQVALSNTNAQENEPRIVTDTYKEYLLLLTVLGSKAVYGVNVVNEQGPDKCYLMVKGNKSTIMKEIVCYLAPIQAHCSGGCTFCLQTRSFDTKNMAFRDGNKVYALCFSSHKVLQPLKGVVTERLE